MGVHRKIRFLDGFTKKKYIGAGGGDCLRRGFGKFAGLKGSLTKRGGGEGVFEGGGGIDTPMHTM